MQKLNTILFIICLLISFDAKAGVIDDLEDRISQDKDLNFVSVTLYKTPKNLRADQKINGIRNMIYTPGSSNRFSAEVLIDGKPYAVQGKYDEASLIPAFKSYIQKGHTVDYSDLISVKVAKQRMAPQLLVQKNELVGKKAKRKLPPNQPIHAKDLTHPNIIEKGATVKMVFVKTGLVIEAAGLALEGGALGDYIKVKNLDSNKIVKAKIKDEATVSTNG